MYLVLELPRVIFKETYIESATSPFLGGPAAQKYYILPDHITKEVISQLGSSLKLEPLDLTKEIINGNIKAHLETNSLKFTGILNQYNIHSYTIMNTGIDLICHKFSPGNFPVYTIIDMDHKSKYCKSLMESSAIRSVLRDKRLESILSE